ncbi:hypothetical protein CO058_02295 [candidate division WWE3 bacterium CG_4_9_14_0_2_um_filter_35_11]|uniref:Glycosyltransferase family 1 protein n=1 Tax=candidate division WWE3 bacterium CG_4_9_14_0_2_um_filter_35_11 TaxID=1975077 RepID=A0A2M8ELS1_UNCKA|nr:MAG: hypothetical protein COV25_00425 [candidate division WWE3 bacterium CG10_big_fil_rev_8_21_14_0_10_35_32]PJC23678.1 MAG: hypothetical protein CO058_02295 [candidate division WWE3 bacterium CG_4_9_14_0_2_um_filter_35_11]
MKILLLSSRFFPHVGGVEKVIESLAKKLSKNNDITVLSSLDETSKNILKIETEIINKDSYRLKRIWMNVPRSFSGFLIFPFRFVRGIFGLVRFLKSEKPDVINFHFLDDVSLYLWASRFFYKTPLVVNIHGNDLHVFSKNLFYSFFISSLLNGSDKIIVNSKYMMNDLLNFFKLDSSKIEIIPNGIDLKYIEGIKPKKYIKEDYIFYVGRFVRKKGVDILIRAFSEIKSKDLKLVIEGKGEELNSIKSLISDIKLSDRAILAGGNLSDEEKFSYMKGALAAVIPSRIEPFGIVALEYLSSGVPLIASKTGGLVDLLEDKKNCLFFNNEDINDLTSKIDTLIDNKNLQEKLSGNGLELAREYTWDEVSDKYLKLYKSVLIKP